MNSDIVNYTFTAHTVDVRSLKIDGEPWFVAKDVCDALGINNVSSACEKLDKADVRITLVDTENGRRDMTIINEPGLYWLIVRSDKPNARPFIKWITHDVLPSIRRTGGYQLPGGRPLSAGTKWGRQPLLDVIKQRGYTQGRFVEAVLECNDDDTLNAGKFMSYATGKVLPNDSMIVGCEKVLGISRDQLFTSDVLAAYGNRGMGRRHTSLRGILEPGHPGGIQ